MAKPTFAKMGLKINDKVNKINIGEQEIEVKQYLPIDDKIQLVTNVLVYSLDENNFPNPMKMEVYTNLELIFNYTNITFTDKQKEDVTKLYDLLESNGIIAEIISAMDPVEYDSIISFIEETSHSYYTYKNSALGIMEAIGSDYSQMDFDATEIQKKIADPENLALLKDVMSKMG